MAFMSFFGYIFFVLFGGVGLTALPMDLITTFTNRPKIVKKRIYQIYYSYPLGKGRRRNNL